MKISYLGHSSFKIIGKTGSENVTVITDPFDPKMVGLNFPTTEADVVTISHHHPDHDYLDKIKPRNGGLFVADTPGEFEIKDLRIFGIKSYHDNTEGKERGQNTIFVFDFQEARVAHLGDLGHELNSDQMEELENVEVLMIPVGGEYTIDSKLAMQVIEDIEPLIVIPMHYKTSKHTPSFSKLEDVSSFLEKAGPKVLEPKAELIIKGKEDLPSTLTIIQLTN